MSVSKPKIGITVGKSAEETHRNYRAAVERAGGEPVMLRPNSDPALFDTVDGILLSGGGDVNPAVYGQDRHPRVSGVSNSRDSFELAAIARAFERDLPILGICRGFQVLNVATGGSLIQHIDDHAAKAGESAYHSIDVAGESKLAQAIGAAGDVAVNSRHHQAITPRELAPGLQATATSADGYIEAFEKPGTQWVVGIQCHPERAAEVDPRFAGLFETFVNEARRARDQR